MRTHQKTASLRDQLSVLLPIIAPELLSANASARITRWAADFPPVAGMVEAHLGGDLPRGDLLLRFPRGGPAIDGPADGPVWARLREFDRDWARPGSSLAAFGQTWLEFDLPDDPSATELPIPSFFADLDLAPGNTAGDQIAAVRAALAILRAGAPAPLDLVSRCVGELPPGARLLSLGLMFSRPTDAVRVCLADLRADDVPAYLARIGWAGSAELLRAVGDRLAGFTSTVALALDVDSVVRPRLGVEYHLEVRGGRLRGSVERWAPFLDRLVTDGLCAPHKRDPLLACIGFDRDPTGWPAELRAAAQRHGPDVLSVLMCRLNHVKVVVEPGRPTEAKAYLQLTHDRLRIDPVTQQADLTMTPLPDGD
ncbi:MAG TPA: hypothetical protein VHW44_17675 [Pseudonocardiaceae bacterium]|jgi:hypothetical protein|nr:hypothetical protein [Pseudonocardiaceae bacterium]